MFIPRSLQLYGNQFSLHFKTGSTHGSAIIVHVQRKGQLGVVGQSLTHEQILELHGFCSRVIVARDGCHLFSPHPERPSECIHCPSERDSPVHRSAKASQALFDTLTVALRSTTTG